MIDLRLGDSLEILPTLADNSVDAVVCDPPYELGFMGKAWDNTVIAYNVDVWRECLRVLKPGGHLLAFGGSRTYHRLACAVEDAGFVIRDSIAVLIEADTHVKGFLESLNQEQKLAFFQAIEDSQVGGFLGWCFGSGFPKSLDVSKALDKAAGAEREVVGEMRYGTSKQTWGIADGGIHDQRKIDEKTGLRHVPQTLPATPAAQQWSGFGTALKPAHEPVVMARKPLIGTVADNVLAWGVGGINIDGCRVEANSKELYRKPTEYKDISPSVGMNCSKIRGSVTDDYLKGRFPANLIHDGSDEVLAGFPVTTSGTAAIRKTAPGMFGLGGDGKANIEYGDTGSAARFFYCAKASPGERNAGLDGFDKKQAGSYEGRNDGSLGKVTYSSNPHPTVKPISLMRYLCKLVTPPGGTVLDPFMGSGSCGIGAVLEGFGYIGIEKEAEYYPIAQARIEHWTKTDGGSLF